MLYCRGPCTEDEEEQGGACVPADCAAKYDGARDFWDAAARACVAEGQCPAGFEGAACAPAPTPAPSPPAPGAASPPAFAPAPLPGSVAVECGAHGAPSAGGLSCDCAEGWATRPAQDLFSFVWCDEPLLPANLPVRPPCLGRRQRLPVLAPACRVARADVGRTGTARAQRRRRACWAHPAPCWCPPPPLRCCCSAAAPPLPSLRAAPSLQPCAAASIGEAEQARPHECLGGAHKDALYVLRGGQA